MLPGQYSNIQFDLAGPEDAAAFRHVIAADGRATLHIHHVIGLDIAALDMLMACFARRVITLHDYYFVCPQITLRDHAGKPCNVRPSKDCDHCVAVLKPAARHLKPVAAHRAAMTKIAAGAERVFTPSASARDLLVRGLGSIPITVAPHADRGPLALARPASGGTRTIVTIGAFSADKGAVILAEVIRDAGERSLPLRFVLAGPATWEKPPKNVTVLGPYDRDAIADILVRVGGHIAFLPSIVAETYMFSLSECVRAGYFPVVFDIGAQAERVRQLGWGSVLPLGTSPRRIGDYLAGIDIPPLDSGRVEEWLSKDRIGPLDYYT
jgi:glycosyltransferase involved in cell wall biosynthesis